MIIQVIKTNGREKLLAIARRTTDKRTGTSIMCDWSAIDGKLRIYWSTGTVTKDFGGDFKSAVKYIWSMV
jgi:hypothetical protein